MPTLISVLKDTWQYNFQTGTLVCVAVVPVTTVLSIFCFVWGSLCGYLRGQIDKLIDFDHSCQVPNSFVLKW